MAFTIFKLVVSASVIAFASWLSGKKPELAGFIIALPLLTMLVLPLSYAEYQNPENAIVFAKSIFLAVPLSLTFFLPFLVAHKIMPLFPPALGFWAVYASGIACIACAYFIHHHLTKLL